MTPSLPGRDGRLPLYQQLHDELKARIAAGQWPPGQLIPTEAELTTHYGLAIGTVRKAVDLLVAEGLLQRMQGRGTFVRRPDFGASFFRFFRQVDARGQQQVPCSEILDCRLAPARAAVAQHLRLTEGALALRLKRLRLHADRQPLSYEEIWLDAERFAPLRTLATTAFEDLLYPMYERLCGHCVASAEETLMVEPASDEAAAHLAVAAGSPVVVVERVAFGYDGQALEYRLSRGAGASFRYQITIS